jgi:hypothetical protein
LAYVIDLGDRMETRISRSLQLVFSDQSTDNFVDRAIDILNTEVIEADKEIRRAFTLLVGSIFVFELLLAAKVGDVTLLGIKMKDPRALLLLIPIVASLFLFRGCDAIGRYSCYADALRSILTTRYPLLWDNDLEFFFTPGDGSLVGATELIERLQANRKLAKVHSAAMMSALMLLVLGGPIYGLAAYYRLSQRHGINGVALAASFIASVLLVAFAAIRLWALMELDTTPIEPGKAIREAAAEAASAGTQAQGDTTSIAGAATVPPVNPAEA